MKSVEAIVLSCLCVCAGVASAFAGERRPEVRDDWAFQHRSMVVKEEKQSGGIACLWHADRRFLLQQPAPLVDEQAGRMASDRDPTDQVARRTDALLAHLAANHPKHADWPDFRRRLDPLLAEAKAVAPDLTGEDPARQKTYIALCALRREIAFSNPLLDFADTLFSVEANVAQVLQRATTGQYNCIGRGHDRNTEPGGGLYILRGWKGNAPQLVDLCKDARVENGRNPRAPNGNYMWDNIFMPGTPYAQLNPPPPPRQPKTNQWRQPCAVSHCHAVPGSRKIMAIGGCHHSVEIGPVMLLDLARPDDYAGGQIVAITPGAWGRDEGGEFSAPWPLSEDFFLANYLDRIYLVDRFGNREFVVRSEEAHQRNRWFRFWLRYYRFNEKAEGGGVPVPTSIPPELDDPWNVTFPYVAWRPTFPRPLKGAPRPPIIPALTFQSEDRRGQPGHKPATITVQNVYDTDIPLPAGVKVKALRLVQVLGASSGNYTGVHGRNTSAVKIVLGTTPVEEDGSVHCLAPIEKGIYFQLLDQVARTELCKAPTVTPGRATRTWT